MDAPEIGDLARVMGVGLHELTPKRASLEAAFMDITRDSVQYSSAAPEVAEPLRALTPEGK
jgi:ABC-2 type transport system ATP-binding protein